jgi:hypothetical protein
VSTPQASSAPAVEQPTFRTMADAAKSLGTHPSAVSRWILRGIKGRDGQFRRLVASRIGGRWMVRQTDLDEFVAAVTADRLDEPTTAAVTSPRLPLARQRAIEQAERELTAAGI